MVFLTDLFKNHFFFFHSFIFQKQKTKITTTLPILLSQFPIFVVSLVVSLTAYIFFYYIYEIIVLIFIFISTQTQEEEENTTTRQNDPTLISQIHHISSLLKASIKQ